MTNLIEFKLDVLYLKAAVLAAAKKDVREQLNGVYFNLINGCLQSTNGHIAFITQPNIFKAYSDSDCKGFLMPIDFAQQVSAIKTGKKEEDRQLYISFSTQSRTLTARLNSNIVSANIQDLPFPNLNFVYQNETKKSWEPIFTQTYSAQNLAIASKIATALKPLIQSKDDTPSIEFKLRDNTAILNINENMVHLVLAGMNPDTEFQYFDLKAQK
ncbi:hypothetical protein B0186_03975 [Canicola haemoglobinophilus]|uniref:DNA polymerase III subunit beta n=1 Tax=Canicola haemoglobinophilus TaxID=733 RepID=A0A1V4B201_9PAST|nr:hypothetical protein [Canicola haemoglobinophilus]OOS01244.1 hypothetical protein B0186_03975 [Canicola haemoglobinophilus]STO54449.1 Uncharacterised protein [Canicola haemoglobinophilus]STO60084.1 Uncharacterised protein [Canicola haemoglobinophilus]STO68983.1 Uncharacterised protein [Canicola haemoglobinophilus]